MNKKGISIVEMAVVMTISSIILLAMTCQFVVEQTCRTMSYQETSAASDASLAMRYVSRIAQFAYTNRSDRPVGIETDWHNEFIGTSVSFYVEGGHLPDFPDPTAKYQVGFGRTGDSNVLGRDYFIFNKLINDVLVQNQFIVVNRDVNGGGMTDFNVTRANDVFTFSATVTRGSKSSSLTTDVRALPNASSG